MYPSPKNLLTDYMERPERQAPGAGGWFDLDDWVGPQHPSGRGDVAKIEGILANSGDYSLERTQGPTGYWGLALDDGIRKYQKRNGLKVDGALRPGGPTIRHMADAFGSLLGGYAPPTPDDIDRHHNIVGNDNPGTIAWQQPPVSFDGIEGLPEIDQATDASNARYVSAMLKSKGFGTLPQLFAKTIEDSGASGLAAVRDLVAKYEQARPGERGQLASAVTGFVSEKAQKQLGIEVPKAPPKGAVQVALTDIIGDTGMAIMGGLLGTATAGAYAIDETSKNLGKLPGRTPADNENKPVPQPAPPLLDVPIDTGGSIETPKASDSIETLPALPEERRKQVVDDLFKELFPNILEVTSYEDRDDYRGDKGLEATHIIIKKLKELMEASDIPDMLEHDGGGSQDAERKEYKKEKTVWNEKGEFNRPDGSVRLKGSDAPEDSAHFNTMTPKRDGTPIKRERLSLERLKETLGDDVVEGFRKRGVGEDLAEFTKKAELFAEDHFKRWYARLWNFPGGR